MINGVTRMSRMNGMLTGGQMKQARESLGLTQAQFGALVGEEGKTIGNWERADHIPPKKQQKVKAALRPELPEPKPEAPDDVELVANLAARLAFYASRIAELEAIIAELSQHSEETGSRDVPADRPNRPTPRAVEGRGPRRR
jgi:DNA-binding XRE family transcriptional regulator